MLVMANVDTKCIVMIIYREPTQYQCCRWIHNCNTEKGLQTVNMSGASETVQVVIENCKDHNI